MKKLIFAILLFCPFGLFGQLTSVRQPLRMPYKYLKPTFETTADFKSTKELTNQFWNVWIDRKGVQTSNGKYPQFMQRFFVIDEKETKIHIVPVNDSFDNSLGEFTKEPEDYGWIEKNQCLLSPHALYSSKTNFRIKVMTITNMQMIQKEIERIREGAKKLAFFDSPTLTNPNNNETPLFEIFYIMKKEGPRYLLSKRPNISTGRAEDFVNGWVDTASVQIWEQRQSLEPNGDVDAAKERQSANLKCSVFANTQAAESFASSSTALSPFWSDDHYSKGYSPYWKRFPIFFKNGNIVETAVVSSLFGTNGKTVDPGIQLELEEMYNNQRQKSRSINLVFVVDGTQSMGPYIESVRQAVIASSRALQTSDNKFKFGAVIYRDYVTPENDDCYKIQFLTDQVNIFSKFLLTINPDEPACIDNTTSEGLYLGLKKVEDVLRGKEKETNIIIIVGDSGDRSGPGRITEDDVAPLIGKFNCGILALQVHYNIDPSYDDFILQLRNIGERNGDEISSMLRQNYGKLNLPALNSQPQWIQTSARKRTFFNLEHSPVSGGLQYAKRGQAINPDTARNEIKAIISQTDEKNNNLLKDLEKLIKSVDNKVDTNGTRFTAETINMLMKIGYSTDQIGVLMQQHYQFLIRGSTPIQIDKMRTPLYNYVLFLDQEELDDVWNSLNKITIPNKTSSDRREALKRSWQDMLRANYGVSPEEISNKNLAELMNLVTGLPSPNPLLQKYKLDDITDKIRLSDDEFDRVVDQIKIKRDLLNKMAGNKEFMFLSNDKAYYWIPQRYLP